MMFLLRTWILLRRDMMMNKNMMRMHARVQMTVYSQLKICWLSLLSSLSMVPVLGWSMPGWHEQVVWSYFMSV